MNRRDVILVSVLVNAGLLSALFVASIKIDESPLQVQELAYEETRPLPPVQVALEISDTPNPEPILEQSIDLPLDEVDHILKELSPEIVSDSIMPPANDIVPQETVEIPSSQENWVQITVKKGDALEKIARANGTTVEKIRTANNLKSDRLKVGQILKVPVGTSSQVKATAKEKKEHVAVSDSDAVYYTVKPGDNPWKIAKQFNVKFEDLLKLNHLDENKAKNLKVGDKLRVR